MNTINEDYFFKNEISLTKIHGGGAIFIVEYKQ